MGIKKLEIASYTANLKNQKFSFAGGHRHRLTIVEDGIHLYFPDGKGDEIDISDVAPARAPGRRHHR
jgi:hypothetical protein